MKWLDKIKQKRQAEKISEAHAEALAVNKRYREASRAVAEQQRKLFNKPCPVNDGAFCFCGCAHYKPGNAYVVTFIEESVVIKVYPGCKLWGFKK